MCLSTRPFHRSIAEKWMWFYATMNITVLSACSNIFCTAKCHLISSLNFKQEFLKSLEIPSIYLCIKYIYTYSQASFIIWRYPLLLMVAITKEQLLLLFTQYESSMVVFCTTEALKFSHTVPITTNILSSLLRYYMQNLSTHLHTHIQM